MKNRIGNNLKYAVVLIFGIVVSLLMGCGGGSSGSPSTPATATVTGTVSTNSAGTTEATTTTVSSPEGVTLKLQPSTTLTNTNGQAVVGTIPTSVTYSADISKLPAEAVIQGMPDVAVFLDIVFGTVKNIAPPMSAIIYVPGIAAGTLVDIYSFNGTAWVLEYLDVSVAENGTVPVNIGHLSIWAVCKKGTLTISGTPSTSVRVGSAYNFVPEVTATNPASVKFSIINKPVWASFSATTGALTGTPTTAHIGTTTGIVITATSLTLTKALPAFNVIVSAVVTGGTGGTGGSGF